MINLQVCSNYYTISILSFFIVLLPTIVLGECTCELESEQDNRREYKYKIAGIVSILVAGGVGVSLPQLGRKVEVLNPESDIFFMIKAFAAGVILATAFVHVLPDAFDNLTSPCLKDNPWGKFPFAGFVAMMSSIGTLMVDSFATCFYRKLHLNKGKQQDEERVDVDHDHDHDHNHDHDHDQHTQTGQLHLHTHAHASVIPSHEMGLSDLIRQRIISQVLELGIVVHSVIIGISMGASESPDTIKPLLAALSFHQFFEGMGLGGCISQAKFKSLSTVIMTLFFSLTTPIGIGIGIGISSVYNKNSTTALIVEGIFNSASAGILIYMALVDLLAADFMNPRMQSNSRLQLGANISLLLGAGCMSVLAKWA